MLSDVGEPGREGALGHPEQRESDIGMRNGPESQSNSELACSEQTPVKRREPAIKGYHGFTAMHGKGCVPCAVVHGCWYATTSPAAGPGHG